MLFHFQYRSEDRWESIGSGEGEGVEAPVAALAELNGLTSGTLPVGTYRCIAARANSANWELLAIEPGGAIGFADEAAAADAEVLGPSVRTPHHA